MEIRFDVYFKKNLGTLFKSNEIDLDGILAHTNLDLKSVDRLEANYKVGTQKYTDSVGMVDIEERVIQIPFKSDVVKVGLNEFEIVAYMLNGDIKTSQTYTYNIDEAIGEGVISGGSGDGHFHANLTILNSITQTKINEWNNKANKEHTHSDYAEKNHTHNANEIEGLDNIDIDLSSYYTKSETDDFINNKADKGHTHSQYLTEHQDISHKADKENTYTKAQTDNKIVEEIAKAQIGGSGEVDLSAYATKNYVDDEISKIELKEGPQGPTGQDGADGKDGVDGKDFTYDMFTKEQLEALRGPKGIQGEQGPKGDKGDTGLTTSVTIGSTKYTHSNGNITIPAYPTLSSLGAEPKNSNIQAHITSTHAPSDAQKNSDITKAEIEAKLTGNITSHTHNQYLTEHQDLSNYATKSELHNHTNKTVLDGITSAKVNEWNNKSTFNGNYNSLTNKPTIPTKTSQLTNDSNFLTSVPSEYVTDSELNAKGYLTEHQDISGKLNKNLGAENVGKMLVVGSDGNIVTMDIPSGGATGDVIGTVDENNNILLSGNLSDGTYVLKYENEDGTYSDVGNLVIGEIKPSEPEPEPTPGNLFNLETTKLNTRLNSSGTEKTANGVWLTDLIPLNPVTDHTIYVKNAIMMRDVTTSPWPQLNFFDESGKYLFNIGTNASNSSYKDYTELLGENYTKIRLDTNHTTVNVLWSSVRYMRIAGIENESDTVITKDDIKDVIITLNVPIE